MNKIIITLEGGVIQDVSFKDCEDIIEVEVKDFDADGVDEDLLINEEGEYYIASTYSNEADKLGLTGFPQLTGDK